MEECKKPKHPRNVGEYTDMKKLAEDIGNLHYETLVDLMIHMADKLEDDANSDKDKGRRKLSHHLNEASLNIVNASSDIDEAWRISKPFMKDDED